MVQNKKKRVQIMGGYTRKYGLAMEKDIKGVYIQMSIKIGEDNQNIQQKVTYSRTFFSII